MWFLVVRVRLARRQAVTTARKPSAVRYYRPLSQAGLDSRTTNSGLKILIAWDCALCGSAVINEKIESAMFANGWLIVVSVG